MKELTIPMVADFHIHLRQGDMMLKVTELLRNSGVNVAYVMPNLTPPITNTAEALDYQRQLTKIAPEIQFLMTIYLNPKLTPNEIYKAAEAGIRGVKCYPKGVTTNSDSGVESFLPYYPVFKAMEETGMVLNLHGEVPSNKELGICIMNAEEMFLSRLEEIHSSFPKLKIVLEHATTKAAVEKVKALGPTVGCSITLHHLQLIVDDWASNSHNFCKPVAKYPEDRLALCQIIKEGHEKFFLGTDSAPHNKADKESGCPKAGVFTGAHIVEYAAHLLDQIGCLENLAKFTSIHGRKFYGMKEDKDLDALTLIQESHTIPSEYVYHTFDGKEQKIVPFMASETLQWKLRK